MKKIYVFLNGKSSLGEYYCAIAEDGEVVAGHVCSSVLFMDHDMGFTSNWQHDKYDAHFGKGNWELEFVDNIATHAGYQAALAANRRIYREQVEPEREKPNANE